jgi:hypothetical protein
VQVRKKLHTLFFGVFALFRLRKLAEIGASKSGRDWPKHCKVPVNIATSLHIPGLIGLANAG